MIPRFRREATLKSKIPPKMVDRLKRIHGANIILTEAQAQDEGVLKEAEKEAQRFRVRIVIEPHKEYETYPPLRIFPPPEESSSE